MRSECRICLKISYDVLDIFLDNLPSKIEEFSGVEILPDYGYPTKICDECVENIHLFYKFRDQIIESNTALDCEIFEVQGKDTLKLHCRTCLTVSENATNLFRDGLPHKIEVISLCEILQDDKLPSKICTLCEEFVCSLYNFRNAIIANSEIICKRIGKMEHDINIKEMELENGTFELNEIVRQSGGIVTPIIEKNYKKGVHMYKCLPCTFFTTSYITWLKHNRSHQEPTSIVCEICGKLILRHQLSEHIKCHSTKKVTCPTCGQILKHEISLKIHLKRHDKTERFECSKCGKVYKKRHTFKIHLDGHEGKLKKNYKCSLCEKLFCDKSRLKTHFRSHTGERPYVCDICSKGFSSSNALKTHIRQHTQEKPYTCRYCDAAFKQAVLVRRHLKLKHPEKVVVKSST